MPARYATAIRDNFAPILTSHGKRRMSRMGGLRALRQRLLTLALATFAVAIRDGSFSRTPAVGWGQRSPRTLSPTTGTALEKSALTQARVFGSHSVFCEPRFVVGRLRAGTCKRLARRTKRMVYVRRGSFKPRNAVLLPGAGLEPVPISTRRHA